MIEYRRIIDVSGHQGDIDWDAVAKPGALHCPSGVDCDVAAVIVKLNEGSSPRYATAKPQADGVRRVGLPLGLYHYATAHRRPSGDLDPIEEAQATWDALRSLGFEGVRLIALDLEQASDIVKSGLDDYGVTRWVRDYLGNLSGRLVNCANDVRCVCLYGRSAVKLLRPEWGIGAVWPLWVPRYRTNQGENAGDPGELPRAYTGHGWLMHQYTSKAHVDGIKRGEGDVDVSVMRAPDFDRVFV